MREVELLLPAGNMEKLEYAIKYGANAVYLGVVDFSLRAMRKGELITPDNLKQQMNQNDEQFISPDFRFIVVKSISQSNIEAAIRKIASESYYLDFYGSDLK